MQISNDGLKTCPEEISIHRLASQAEDPGRIQLTPELIAELLDPESWGKILALYARTMNLAVALLDGNGQLLGSCHNPQPVWTLAHDSKPGWTDGGCVFCLERTVHCTAVADARQTNSLALAHDQGGFAHVALSLTVGSQHVGTVLAGQVLDRYAELLPLHRLAREFDLPPQQIWDLARQQPPMSRANLTTYGELLGMLSRTFLRDRYGAILERRSTEAITALNQQLAIVNATLTQKVAELDQSNNYLRHLFESTETANIFLDHELRIETFTPAAAKWFRLDVNDTGRRLQDLRERFAGMKVLEQTAEPVTNSVVERIIEMVRAFPLETSQGVRQEMNLTGAQDQHSLLRLIPYRDNQGRINGAVVTFIDVTTLKKAQELIEMEKLYAEHIVATVPEPLLVLDDTFHVQSVNQAFCETFETNAEETAGRLLYELGNGQWDISGLRQLMNELLQQNHWVEDFEVEHDFAKLGLRTMLINARRIAARGLILLAIRDITERKRSENALRKLNADLKHFSYAASHDLQEPLRTVSIYTQLLAQKYKGTLDPQGDDFIAFVMGGAERIGTLLKELREYWLVTEGIEGRTPIDCEAVLQKTIQALQLPIKDSGARVTHEPLPTVLAEEVSLATLFQNLMSNAIKYRRAGEPPSIHLSARKTASAWCFSVSDNGIGIQPEYLEKVFAPFKRLNTKDYPGTGIGLALCNKIVEKYGGRLWVESIHGQGSTFFFTIPHRAEPVQLAAKT